MESEPRSYELAYLLSPSIPEEEALGHTHKLNNLIEEVKGLIQHAEQPSRYRLAYRVKKERNAYFGWTAFRCEPMQIASLEKRLQTIPELLRFMVIQQDEHKQKLRQMKPFDAAIARPAMPPRTQQQTLVILREADKTDDKLDLEALDKKLEEILGK
ncbi:MAG: 30S ribosomal protein S6 [bacterium]|nr:30S ribosomal protein S6 [bacterium]MDZ4299992.1 30S ribosomal protein S6 [Candidatus Sungbacteria bacterium]